MNLVLSDCEEWRQTTAKGKPGVQWTDKRALGLVILRGENVVCMQVEAPPPNKAARRTGPGGPGVAAPMSRAAPAAGLAGPVAGVGGAAPPTGMLPPGMAPPGTLPPGMGTMPPGMR